MVEKMNLQDAILNECREDKVGVTVFLMNGVQMHGNIVGFDEYVVVVWTEGRQKMVFKHAISTIIPDKKLTCVKS